MICSNLNGRELQEPILSCDWKKTNMHRSIFFWIYLKPYSEVEWVIYSYNRVRKRKDFMSKRNEPCFCAQSYILKEMGEESILCLWILAWSSIYIVKKNFFYFLFFFSITGQNWSLPFKFDKIIILFHQLVTIY